MAVSPDDGRSNQRSLALGLFAATVMIPGMLLSGFIAEVRHVLDLPTALVIAALGGAATGAIGGYPERACGFLGGVVAGVSCLLAVHFYTLGREVVFRIELLAVLAVGALPGVVVYGVLCLARGALAPSRRQARRPRDDLVPLWPAELGRRPDR